MLYPTIAVTICWSLVAHSNMLDLTQAYAVTLQNDIDPLTLRICMYTSGKHHRTGLGRLLSASHRQFHPRRMRLNTQPPVIRFAIWIEVGTQYTPINNSSDSPAQHYLQYLFSNPHFHDPENNLCVLALGLVRLDRKIRRTRTPTYLTYVNSHGKCYRAATSPKHPTFSSMTAHTVVSLGRNKVMSYIGFLPLVLLAHLAESCWTHQDVQ